MKLSDLRKLAVKKNVRVRFQLSNGLECVLNEHGIVQIPALRQIPDFSLEDEFAQVAQFVLEPLPAEKNRKPENLSRDQMAALLAPAGAEPTTQDHDD